MIEKGEKRTPPYAPWESFNRLLARMREASPLPRPMDSSFWVRMRFSGSITSALKGTLVYLGLLTPDGMPTPDLEPLVANDVGGRKTVLREIFRKTYEPILTRIDLERATRNQLRVEFKNLGADGEVGKKAISFFLAMAKEVGERLHPHLLTRQPRAKGERKQRPQTLDAETSKDEERAKQTEREAYTSSLPMALHPALAGLLQALPKPNQGWNQRAKQKFKTAFEAMLDVIYPTEDTVEP